MLGFLIAALAVPSQATVTSVEHEVYKYCQSFCGSSNVDVCDYGPGNGAEWQDMEVMTEDEITEYRRQYEKVHGHHIHNATGLKGGATERRSSNTTLGGCSETQTQSCVNSDGAYHWCNYYDYRCTGYYMGLTGAATYYDITKTAMGLDSIDELWYDNALPIDTTTQLTKEYDYGKSQCITHTSGMKTSVSIKASFGIPDEMGISVEDNFEFSVSTSSESCVNSAQKFTVSTTIPVAANSTTKVIVNVESDQYDADWSQVISMPYDAKLWCGSEVNGHHEWFFGASHYMASPFKIGGKFSGIAGKTINIQTFECTLDDHNC